MKRSLLLLSCLPLLAASAPGKAAETSNKSAYTLFNAVPEGQLRELSPDRPDKTESTVSVDAGHFQFEASLVSLARDGEATETTFMELNAKAGLTANTDLQLVIVPASSSGSVFNVIPEAQVRFKWNLVGNDGGDFSVALLPYVSIPTTDGASFDTGLAVPVGFSLPGGFDLGAMVAMESFTNQDLAAMATLGHDLFEDFSGYVELYSVMPAMKTDSMGATFDVGVNYALSPNTQFDLGANIGLTDAATDLEVFLGATVRF